MVYNGRVPGRAAIKHVRKRIFGKVHIICQAIPKADETEMAGNIHTQTAWHLHSAILPRSSKIPDFTSGTRGACAIGALMIFMRKLTGGTIAPDAIPMTSSNMIVQRLRSFF